MATRYTSSRPPRSTRERKFATGGEVTGVVKPSPYDQTGPQKPGWGYRRPRGWWVMYGGIGYGTHGWNKK